LGERAEQIIEAFDDRQVSTQQALEQLERIVGEFNDARREQAETGFDLRTFTLHRLLAAEGVAESRTFAPRLAALLAGFPNHAVNANDRRSLKASLYKELLPAVGKEHMVEIAEKVLKVRA